MTERVMRLALQRFEEDRQRRQAQYQERREQFLPASPACGRSTGELRSTMSRIITSALRHGTDPRSAVAVLGDENLSLPGREAGASAEDGLPEDALGGDARLRPLGDTGYRNGRVCRCLPGLCPGAAEGAVPMLTWGTRALTPSPQTGTRTAMTRTRHHRPAAHGDDSTTSARILPTSSASARRTSCSSAHPDWERPTSPPPLPGRSARRGIRWFMTPRATSLHNSSSRSSPGKRRGRRPRGAGAELRSADSGRSGIRDDHILRSERPVPDCQHPPDGAPLHHHQHKPDAGRSWPGGTRPRSPPRIEGEYTLLPFAGEDIRKLKKERARGN